MMQLRVIDVTILVRNKDLQSGEMEHLNGSQNKRR